MHLALAFVGIALLIYSRSSPAIVVSTLISGLGLSAVYPLTIARLTQIFGSDAHRPAGLMFALAGFGGACLPWLVGYTSSHSSGLRAGLWVPLAGCGIMLVLYLSLATHFVHASNDEPSFDAR
jgi:fucose permease